MLNVVCEASDHLCLECQMPYVEMHTQQSIFECWLLYIELYTISISNVVCYMSSSSIFRLQMSNIVCRAAEY